MKFGGFGAALGLAAVAFGGPASAAVLSLSLPGTPSGTINNASFTLVTNTTPSGTGVFGTFLRIQGNENKSTSESGYNTDGTLEFDTKAGVHTHSLTVGDLQDEGGKFVFRLDTNEPDGKKDPSDPEITITRLQLFLTSDINLTGYSTANNNFGAAATQIYEMADSSYDSIHFKDINSGSGEYDMQIAFDKSIFGLDMTKHVVMFAQFGLIGGGFEEFSYSAKVKDDDDDDDGDLNVVPLPATMPMLLGAFGVAGFVMRRKSRKA